MAAEQPQQPEFVLIPVGQTAWEHEGRLAGAADLPLDATGERQVEALGRQLAERGIKIVFASENQTAQQTGRSLAESLGVSLRKAKGLEEVDVGLWEGLTADQLRQRYPRVYKQWVERPASVQLPQGEDLQAAARRLADALVRISVRTKVPCVGVVLGRLAMGLLRCQLEGLGLDNLWQKMDDEATWYCFKLPQEMLENGGKKSNRK
jgi:probable phosphoglycerate mutase